MPAITVTLNPTSVITAIKSMRQEIASMATSGEVDTSKLSASFSKFSGQLLRDSDRIHQAQEKQVAQVERMAAAYGKSPLERMINDRDRLIKGLDGEAQMIARVTAAYDKMMSSQRAGIEQATRSLSSSSGGGSGFSVNYGVRFIKDVMEGRSANAIAEVSNELMAMRGAPLIIGGIVTALGAAGYAAYEFNKHLTEIHEQPAKIAAEFSRLNSSQLLINANMRVNNDQLENSIAKLEHRPENNLKLALDQAAEAAYHLSEQVDKALKGTIDLLKLNSTGAFWSVIGHTTRDLDLQEMLGGKSGMGGMIGEIYKVTSAGGDPTSILSKYRTQFEQLLAQAQFTQSVQAGRTTIPVDKTGRMVLPHGMTSVELATNQDARIEKLVSILGTISSQQAAYDLEKKNADLRSKYDQLTAAKNNTDAALRLKEAINHFTAAGPGSELKRLSATYQEDLSKFPTASAQAQLSTAYTTAFNAYVIAHNKETAKKDIEERLREFGYQQTISESAAEQFKREMEHPTTDLSRVTSKLPANVPGPGEASREVQLAGIQQQLRAQEKIIELTTRPGGELDAAKQIAALRVQSADAEYKARQDTIRATLSEMSQVASLYDEKVKHEQALFTIRMEYAEKVLAVERQQTAEVKRALEPLFATLLTHPGDFGHQLGATIKDHLVSFAAGKMSDMIAGPLSAILHSGGTHMTSSGIPITNIGGQPAVPVLIVNSGAGIGAGSPFARMTGGGIGGILSNLLPGFGGGWSNAYSDAGDVARSGPSPYAHDQYGFAIRDSMSSGGGVQIPGFGGSSGLSIPGLSSILPGGSSMSGNTGIKGLLKNLGSGFGSLIGYQGEGVWNNPGGGSATGGGWTTAAEGVASSPLAGMAGMALASHGLMGPDAGTGKGVLEGTAGGAMVGYRMGGPIGAAVGAGVGFWIGIGEMAAGVESQQREAARLVKQYYHLDINSQMRNEIVSLAKSRYGNSVSIAVRSPEVRQMLGLFAAGTGQQMPMSLGEPHAAALSQMGGSLYQEATYRYGQAYSYASGLPTAGGMPTQLYPSAPQQVSLHISGADAASFMTGNFVTPDYVADRNMSAMQSSNGRLNTSAVITSPGLIVS